MYINIILCAYGYLYSFGYWKHRLQTKRDGGESLGHSVWNYTLIDIMYYNIIYIGTHTYTHTHIIIPLRIGTRARCCSGRLCRDKNRITYRRARIKRLLDFTATVDDIYPPRVYMLVYTGKTIVQVPGPIHRCIYIYIYTYVHRNGRLMGWWQ